MVYYGRYKSSICFENNFRVWKYQGDDSIKIKNCVFPHYQWVLAEQTVYAQVDEL